MKRIILALIVVLLMLGAEVVAFSGSGQPASAQQPGAGLSLSNLGFGPLSGQMSSANFRLDWQVLASGGGVMNSASFRMDSTMGQPATGNTSSSNFKLHTGYWQEMYMAYLPAVMRP